MHIGPYTLASRLLLAPMAGITDRPFRQLCRRFGAGLAVSEMVTSDTRLWHSRKSRHRLDHTGETGPVSVQILGNEPLQMAEAARRHIDGGADIIDINMGCPAKKVCNQAAGSALLADERRVARILEAVVAAAGAVPVTLKIRLGIDREHINGRNVARIAQDCGIAMLAVHGRTRACRFTGEVDYAAIGEIKAAVSIPVVANGDIDSGHKAREVLRATCADGLMIGRAALGRPWIFRDVAQFLDDGREAAQPGAQEIIEFALEHVRAMHDFYGEATGVRIARKHIGWYLERANVDEASRRQLMQLADAGAQTAGLEQLRHQPRVGGRLAA
ncbi:MAG: tRNA dihydrouridine synthase DusB [Chromatiales bacterium]|nr:tRNA dihydrouridine synthase DusB [Chromatiales bacterium]